MKIDKVDVFLVGAQWRNFTMVKLTTEDGLVGWGEGTLGWKEFSVHELILDYGRRYVIGHNPFDIEDLWFKLYQIDCFHPAAAQRAADKHETRKAEYGDDVRAPERKGRFVGRFLEAAPAAGRRHRSTK